jgi:hypothetical protein
MAMTLRLVHPTSPEHVEHVTLAQIVFRQILVFGTELAEFGLLVSAQFFGFSARFLAQDWHQQYACSGLFE